MIEEGEQCRLIERNGRQIEKSRKQTYEEEQPKWVDEFMRLFEKQLKQREEALNDHIAKLGTKLEAKCKAVTDDIQQTMRVPMADVQLVEGQASEIDVTCEDRSYLMSEDLQANEIVNLDQCQVATSLTPTAVNPFENLYKQSSDHVSAMNVHQASELKWTSSVTDSVVVDSEHQLLQEASHNNKSQQPRSSSVQLTSGTPLKGEAASDRLQVSTVQQVASQWKCSNEDVFVSKGASLARSTFKKRLHISKLCPAVVPVNDRHLRVRRRLACSVRSSSGTKWHRKRKQVANCQCPVLVCRPSVSMKQIPAKEPDLTVAATLPIVAMRHADVHRARVRFKRRMHFKAVPVRRKTTLVQMKKGFITKDARMAIKEDVLRQRWKSSSTVSKVRLNDARARLRRDWPTRSVIRDHGADRDQAAATRAALVVSRAEGERQGPASSLVITDEANVRAQQRRDWPNSPVVMEHGVVRDQVAATRAALVTARATEEERQVPASGKKSVVSSLNVSSYSHTGPPAGEGMRIPHVEVEVITEPSQCDRVGMVKKVRPKVVEEERCRSSSEFKLTLDERKGQCDQQSSEGGLPPAVYQRQVVSSDSTMFKSRVKLKTPVERRKFPRRATCHASRLPVFGKKNLSTRYSSCSSPGNETGPPAGAVAVMVATSNQEERKYDLYDSNSKEEGDPEGGARSKTALIVKRHINAKVSSLSTARRSLIWIIGQEKFVAVRSPRFRQLRQVFDRGRHRKPGGCRHLIVAT